MPERRTTQHDATGPVGRHPVLPLRSLALRHETTPVQRRLDVTR